MRAAPPEAPGRKLDIAPASLSAQSLGRNTFPARVTPSMMNWRCGVEFMAEGGEPDVAPGWGRLAGRRRATTLHCAPPVLQRSIGDPASKDYYGGL
jgi:hypothetical protein